MSRPHGFWRCEGKQQTFTGMGIAGQTLPGGFLKTHQVRDEQPTKHQVVAVAEIGLERGKQTRYFLRQPGEPDHGWPPCRLRMSLHHPSAYLGGDQPASTLSQLRSLCRATKNQDYQTVPHFNLSSLSKEVYQLQGGDLMAGQNKAMLHQVFATVLKEGAV